MSNVIVLDCTQPSNSMHIAMSKTGPSKTLPVVVWWSRHPISNCNTATPSAEQNKTNRGDLVHPRDSAKRKK
ncbi:MAG: hypothetical protein NTY15_13195 [Planctomycetota bacterium]|nr:hypothetical protein [Planctomycetota bacterium]